MALGTHLRERKRRAGRGWGRSRGRGWLWRSELGLPFGVIFDSVGESPLGVSQPQSLFPWRKTAWIVCAGRLGELINSRHVCSRAWSGSCSCEPVPSGQLYWDPNTSGLTPPFPCLPFPRKRERILQDARTRLQGGASEGASLTAPLLTRPPSEPAVFAFKVAWLPKCGAWAAA